MKPGLLVTVVVLSSALVAGSDPATAADAATRKDRFTPEERSYWAFQPVASPKVPSVRDGRWVRNPIDAFILSQLEAKGLRPSAPADRVTLLRRVTLDLVGCRQRLTKRKLSSMIHRPEPTRRWSIGSCSPALWRAVGEALARLARYAESEVSRPTRPDPILALPRLCDPFLQSGQTV
jgi:hypothetical protein